MQREQRTIAGVGLAGGLLSGLLGVGGGIFVVPGLVLAARFTQRRAHATSLASIVPVSLAGAIVYAATEGFVNVPMAAVLAAGSVVGAPLGVRALARVPERALRIVFAIVTLSFGVRLLVT